MFDQFGPSLVFVILESSIEEALEGGGCRRLTHTRNERERTGGGKGFSERRCTALQSIRIVAEESFPNGYIFDKVPIEVASGDCLR